MRILLLLFFVYFIACKTALEKYIDKPDPNFKVKLHSTLPLPGLGQGYILNMTSLKWLNPQVVTPSKWEHYIHLVVPNNVQYDTALFIISSGSNGSPPPSSINPLVLLFANVTRSVVAELRMIPNQPSVFTGDGQPRREDALIAYTYKIFMDDPKKTDPSWIARFPMVKASIRGLDAVQQFVKKHHKIKIKNFAVQGASKRGWTAWFVAALDKRVSLVIPTVIDILETTKVVENIWNSICFWPPALQDYQNEGIFDRIREKGWKELIKHEDPIQYKSKLKMPKYIVNSAGDQFFPPDSSRFYYHKLKGDKYLRYIPNSDHSLSGTDAPETVASFYMSHLLKQKLPKVTWKIHKNGKISAQTDGQPLIVKLWQITNNQTRDFRRELLGDGWTESVLTGNKGRYEVRVPDPPSGWTAFFIEFTFPGFGGPLVHKFTTEVSVVPTTWPCSLP